MEAALREVRVPLWHPDRQQLCPVWLLVQPTRVLMTLMATIGAPTSDTGSNDVVIVMRVAVVETGRGGGY